MSDQLTWIERDGTWTAQGHGFEYSASRVHDQSHSRWYPKIAGQVYNSAPDKERAQEVCQSHHSAVCAAIQEESAKALRLGYDRALWDKGDRKGDRP